MLGPDADIWRADQKLDRYGAALDRLAGTRWARGASSVRLLPLGIRLVDECEISAEFFESERQFLQDMNTPAVPSKERKALAASAEKTARLLRGLDLTADWRQRAKIARALGERLCVPAELIQTPSDPRMFTDERLDALKYGALPDCVATALEAMARNLRVAPDARSGPRKHSEGYDTALCRSLVSLLRAATGSPCFKVAEAFLHARFPNYAKTSAVEIKRRLEAQTHRARTPT